MNANPLAADLDHILDHTRELWDELRGQRIFITGGTGFFGCWLLESFLWANEHLKLKADVVVLTRNREAVVARVPHLAQSPSVTLLTGDVRSFEYPAGEFSHIIHAATPSTASLNNANPQLMLDAIVQGTRHTLEFAIACKARKFLLTSSGAVYGKQPPDFTHIPEEYAGAPDPLDKDPLAGYGRGKLKAEQLCAQFARESHVEMKIARGFAFVGPYLRLDAHFAIGNFINDALNGGPIVVRGDGTPRRSYLYAADLMIWLWTILLRGAHLRAYNVGSEESLSIAEVAQAVADVYRRGIKVEIQGKAEPGKRPEAYVPSVSRAKNELGLSESIPLRTSIEKTIDWWQRARS